MKTEQQQISVLWHHRARPTLIRQIKSNPSISVTISASHMIYILETLHNNLWQWDRFLRNTSIIQHVLQVNWDIVIMLKENKKDVHVAYEEFHSRMQQKTIRVWKHRIAKMVMNNISKILCYHNIYSLPIYGKCFPFEMQKENGVIAGQHTWW